MFWAARSGGPVDVDPDYRVLERGFDGFPLIETDDRSIGKVQFFDDWVTHKDADAYWEDIDDPRRAHTIRAPVLLMGGWYDPFLPTQLRDFITIRREADRRGSGHPPDRRPVDPCRCGAVPRRICAEPYRRASLAPASRGSTITCWDGRSMIC